MSKEFQRRVNFRHPRLRNKGKQLWRKPKGRDNKMRLKRKSYPSSPTVGHKSPKIKAGLVRGKHPVLVYNYGDVDKAEKGSLLIIAKVGAKKKMEILKRATERGIAVLNLGDSKNEARK